MESLTSVKIRTTSVNKAKKIKKETGVPIGKQYEMAFDYYNKRPKEIIQYTFENPKGKVKI